ncbi:hypothetical protein [Castellaniella sp.]|uniref:hypothetical protein n=1 Tax=Castellaniella sp. TaxID=1955812 RepID=UPI002AFF0BCB|nr:hypothetical protein [Castellaniella sp.]
MTNNQQTIEPDDRDSLAAMATKQMIEDHGEVTTEAALLLLQSRTVVDAIMSLDASLEQRREIALWAAQLFSEIFALMHNNIDALGHPKDVCAIASAIGALMEPNEDAQEAA